MRSLFFAIFVLFIVGCSNVNDIPQQKETEEPFSNVCENYFIKSKSENSIIKYSKELCERIEPTYNNLTDGSKKHIIYFFKNLKFEDVSKINKSELADINLFSRVLVQETSTIVKRELSKVINDLDKIN